MKKTSRGRPWKGKDREGKPARISEYPKLAVYMQPVLKAQLHAAAAIVGKPAWEVVNEAVEQYIQRLPKPDREAVEMLAERVSQRTSQ